MAHWAEIDENNVVISVTVGDNSEPDEGYSWLVENLGGNWIKTSYNGTFRKNFAGVGYTYDESLDAFIPPRPFPSWNLSTETCLWEPPIPRPNDYGYIWDEDELKWIIQEIDENGHN